MRDLIIKFTDKADFSAFMKSAGYYDDESMQDDILIDVIGNVYKETGPKRDKPESNRHAIPSPGADFCRIAVMGESQIQDIVAKVLFFREY